MGAFGVYCVKETLEHKKHDGTKASGRICYWEASGRICYWEFMKLLKVGRGDRFWFASEGRWQGYFILEHMIEVPGEGCDVEWYSDSWVECDGGPRKPFQGVTYKVPEGE
jgi:hypothetical protein